jgi:predicted nucleic acid-binding protein
MSRAFLIDTNVLSELMRTQPDMQVVRWFDEHVDAECYTCSITKAEIFLGIALLPAGIRQTRLTVIAEKNFSEDFSGPCLPFDDQSAIIYAKVVSHRRRTGKQMSTEDAQIAAIALTHDLTLVTRNTKDFMGIEGLMLVNPWDGA